MSETARLETAGGADARFKRLVAAELGAPLLTPACALLWKGAVRIDGDVWADALDPYFDLHDSIGTHADARSAAMLVVEETGRLWTVRQILADPAGDHDWSITATVDLEESDAAGVAVVRVTSVGMS